MKMTKEEIGAKMSEIMGALVGDNAEALDSRINAIVEKKLADSSATVVTHEIKIGDADPKRVEGLLAQEFDDVLSWTATRDKNGHYNAVMLCGLAGTGKGTMARQVAEALDANFCEVNAVKDSFGLTGFIDANGQYNETPFYQACKDASEGVETVFLFDEMDCSSPDVLKIFNEALSSFEFTFPNGEFFEFGENMHFISACNTYGTGGNMKYCGEPLDVSTLDRFALIEVDYDPKIDLACAGGDKDLVKFFHEIRKVTANMIFEASYRSIQRIASQRGLMDMRKVLKQGFIKGMPSDDLEIVKSNLSRVIPDNPYTKSLNGEEVTFEAPASTKKSTAKKSKKNA